ncbi:hypothetical protein STRAU_7692 [Streptomyces aurantiacus JA 4570]|uniref:Uncharacterized protein n=1 Tax=Streptomyces aurantiacus JA 4570 TaxID=1286094 RepID=S3Z678_9ACTN|nr:hypothetical protein STRAU_7692 [Streptomyces aurantiacus JA 4570]
MPFVRIPRTPTYPPYALSFQPSFSPTPGTNHKFPASE